MGNWNIKAWPLLEEYVKRLSFDYLRVSPFFSEHVGLFLRKKSLDSYVIVLGYILQ